MTASRLVPLGGSLVLGLTAMHHAIVPGIAHAQSVIRFTPSMSATQVYDTNLFSSAVDPQSDFITRVSPAIDSEYRKPLLSISGKYTFDIERFADHVELGSPSARQHGGLAFSYRPTTRTTFVADADWLTTETPGELNAATGLTFTRARARRAMGHSSIARKVTARTSATIDYTLTDDRVAGGLEVLSHLTTARVEHRRSPRDTVSVDYGFQASMFSAQAPDVLSHRVSIGWTRAITRRVSLSVAGGPRFTDGSPAPEIAATASYNGLPVDLSVIYARTQATVIGVAGAVDTQSLSGAAMWTLGRSLRARLVPSMFHSDLGGLQARVYRVTVGVARPVAPHLSFDVAFDASVQHGTLSAAAPSATIARRDLLISLVAAPTRPVQ